MNANQKLYTVSQVSEITGVTVKTLHHYQKIGILVPAIIGENRYRYYTDKEIEQLRDIMFYRTLEISLIDVKKLMKLNKSSSRYAVLEAQLHQASAHRDRLETIISTLEKMVLEEKEKVSMEHKDQFEGLKREDDSIYRTMQNIATIYMKPMNLVMFIVNALLVVVCTVNLMFDKPMFIEGTSGYVVTAIMIVIGIAGLILTTRNLHYKSTSELLDIINQKYINK